MATFEFISQNGNTLKLSEGVNYKLVNIDGQTNAFSNLSTSVIGGTDGDYINNVQTQPRTIILDLRIIADVENTKREILNVVKLKQEGTLRWVQNDRELVIKGVIESIEMPRWTNTTMMQISMHCAQPYWENIDYIVSRIDEINSLHYFTTSDNDMLYFLSTGIVIGAYDPIRLKRIYNDGDVAVGMEIEIIALSNVTNPIINNTNGQFFGCGYGTGSKQINMTAGDVIKINTNKNQKSVTLNGTSILTKVKPLSTWLQLESGLNEISINSDDVSVQNMTFYLTYKQRYI